MELNVKTVLVPNKLCQLAGMAVTWQPCNNIGLFPYQRKHYGAPDKPSQHCPTDVSIFVIRQDVILFKPLIRKLVNESNGTFLELQNIAHKKTATFHGDLLKISKQYRSIIRACLENLQEDMIKTDDSIYREELQDYVTIFYSVECIWHLCEILFVDTTPGNIVLPHLLDWVRFHFPKYERNAAEMLVGDLIGLETHPHYWQTVIGSLLQGHVKVVRALLKQHSASDSISFKLVDQTLKAMPTYDVFSGISVEEFNLQWRHWVDDVQSRIDSKVFSANKNLDLLMKLTVRDEVAWFEIQRQCETWYELLAGWLFFTEPAAKSFQLGEYAKTCIKKMNMGDKLKHLDRVLLAAMEFDILEVIKEVQQMSESGWFSTHLTDLLYHSGKLDNLEKEIENFSAKAFHDFHLLEYGTLLMGHKSLWQVGLSYLDHNSTNGLQAIELLLPRVPFEHEMKAQKIVKEALKRDLSRVVQVVCKVQGMKSVQRGRLGNALTWALKSQDCAFVSLLADKFLKQYILNGELISTDLLFNLGPSMLASDRLIFLGKYYEFHNLYQGREYREAGNLLVKLLESKIIPKYFWSILLVEAIPLLESEDMIFSSNDTYMLINCLEENEYNETMKDKLEILRLAAARNLSRAIIYESQVL